MGGGAREMVLDSLDEEGGNRCRNCGGEFVASRLWTVPIILTA